MTTEQAQNLFEKLKRNILSIEMLNAFPNYPILKITKLEHESINGECGNDMTIYLNETTLNQSDMRVQEVLVHELYHFMYPGLGIFCIDDMEEENARESVVQAKTIQYCDTVIPNFNTDWGVSNNYINFYNPTNPIYWLAMQIYALEFGLKDFTMADEERSRIIFSQMFTILSLDKDIDISIIDGEKTYNLNFYNDIDTMNILTSLFNKYKDYEDCYFNIVIDYKNYTIWATKIITPLEEI